MTANNRPMPSLESLLQHRSWVEAVARRLLRDEAAAEDLAQEAWIRALRSPPDPTRDPKPWLRRVLKNLASNSRRGAGRRTKHEQVGGEQRARGREGTRSPAALVAEAEQHRRLVGHVLDLEEPFKTVLVLRFYEGLTPPEIAERTDTAVGTVHSRLSRAIERLKQRLDAEEGGDRKAWIAGLLPFAEAGSPATSVVTAGTAAATAGAAMALSKSKFAWLTVLFLGCLVGGGLWLAGATADDADDAASYDLLEAEASKGEPGLSARGAPPLDVSSPARMGGRPAPSSATPAGWRGVVTDHKGTPVSDALVFVLPREAEGISERVLRQSRFGATRTDNHGRFLVVPGPMDKPRIVAWADTATPTSVLLDGRDRAMPITLVLGAPRALEVTITPEGLEGPADIGLQVDTYGHAFDFTDDPTKQASALSFDWPESDESIKEQLALPSTMALRLRVSAPAQMAAIPRSLAVDASTKRVELRLVRSGAVAYELFDLEARMPLPRGTRTQVYVYPRDSREVVVSSSTADPKFAFDRDLPPGRYVYEVHAQGYVPIAGKFRISRPGGHVGKRLYLHRRTEEIGGRINLTLREEGVPSSALKALANPWPRPAGDTLLAVFVRPKGYGRWSETLVRAHSNGTFFVEPRRYGALDNRFSPGTYDVYVARRGDGMAGYLKSVRIFDDTDNDLIVDMKPGTLLRLEDVAPPDRALREFRLSAKGIRSLPFVRFEAWGVHTEHDEDRLLEQLSSPRPSLIFGPYPTPDLHISLRYEGEQERVRAVVRGASEVTKR